MPADSIAAAGPQVAQAKTGCLRASRAGSRCWGPGSASRHGDPNRVERYGIQRLPPRSAVVVARPVDPHAGRFHVRRRDQGRHELSWTAGRDRHRGLGHGVRRDCDWVPSEPTRGPGNSPERPRRIRSGYYRASIRGRHIRPHRKSRGLGSPAAVMAVSTAEPPPNDIAEPGKGGWSPKAISRRKRERSGFPVAAKFTYCGNLLASYN